MTDSTATQGQVGAGQETPNDSSNLPNQVAFAFRQLVAELDTMKPVKVMASAEVRAVYMGVETA